MLLDEKAISIDEFYCVFFSPELYKVLMDGVVIQDAFRLHNEVLRSFLPIVRSGSTDSDKVIERREAAVGSLCVPQCIVVNGDAGFGKTQLCAEVESGLRFRFCSVDSGGTFFDVRKHVLRLNYYFVLNFPQTALRDEKRSVKDMLKFIAKQEGCEEMLDGLPLAEDCAQHRLLVLSFVCIIDDVGPCTTLLRANEASLVSKLKLIVQLFLSGVSQTTSSSSGSAEFLPVIGPGILLVTKRSHYPIPQWLVPGLVVAPLMHSLPALSHHAIVRFLLERGRGILFDRHLFSREVEAKLMDMAKDAPIGTTPRDLSNSLAIVGGRRKKENEIEDNVKDLFLHALRMCCRSKGGNSRRVMVSLGGGDASSSQAEGALPKFYGCDDVWARLQLLIRTHAKIWGSSGNGGDQQHDGAVLRTLHPTTGILLHGAHGVGKTHLVRRLSAAFPTVPFFFVSAPQLFSKYLGDSEAQLREVFARARAAQPSVVAIDEVELVAAARKAEGRGSADVTRRMLSALLCEMDGLSDAAASSGVLVVATTANPDRIDPAMLRQGRLESVLYVTPPTDADMAQMVEDFLSTWSFSEAAVADDTVARDCVRQALERTLCGTTASAAKIAFRAIVEGYLATVTDGERAEGADVLTLSVVERALASVAKHTRPVNYSCSLFDK